MRETFTRIDTDKNGSLTKEELKAGLGDACFFELLPNEDSSQVLLERMDMDNDGKIDYLEFIQAAVDH